MELTVREGRYVFLCEKYERATPKAAGFRFDWDKFVWWSDNALAAGRLLEWADEATTASVLAASEDIDAVVAASSAQDADIDIPAPDGLEYLPFQRAGIAFASARPATLIADEMGLGKTIEAIGVINNADPTINTVLVVCPASLKLNWQRELEKWLVRPMPVGIVNGTVPDTAIRICNYEQLRKLEIGPIDLLIVDEAHYAKNPKAARTKNVAEWAKVARRVILMTGSPILNRPIELHSLLSMLAPTDWPFWPYVKRYCAAYKGRWGWDLSGSSNLEELQHKLRSTVMVRRLKADVLTELPAKRRQMIVLKGDGNVLKAEREAMERMDSRREDLELTRDLAEAVGDDEAYRQAVQGLREHELAIFTEMSRMRHETAMAKAPAVADHVANLLESVDKVVLMAHHHDVIDLLVSALDQYGVVSLTGEDTLTARQDAVDRFQNNPEVRVFVGSIQAAGVGLTLTASNTVVFAELDWVPGNMSQAEDRCHRIGQVNSVLVQQVVLDGTIDARLAAALIDKQEIIDAAVNGGGSVDRSRVVLKRAPVTASVDEGQRAAIHEGLRQLAALDPDVARLQNGVGYNGADAMFGHALAQVEHLTDRQADAARRMLRKYHRQLGDDLMAQMKEKV